MQFSVPKALIVNPLQLVTGVTEKKSTNPALSHVLLSITSNSLIITGTDSEIELIVKINLSEDHIEGECTVPAKKFVDLVKSFNDDEIMTFTSDGDKAQLSVGSSRFSLLTGLPSDFPSIDEPENSHSFKVSQSKFRTLINSTQFAMAQQDVRYYLNGMLVSVEGELARFVATDGHRLALCETESVDGFAGKISVIVPRKAILEINKLLISDEEFCEVVVDNNHIRFKTEHFCFTSKLVDGRFPDFERVIPKKPEYQVVFDTHEFKSALQRASILCNEKFRGVRLVFEPQELTIFANNPEQEEAEVRLPVDYNGSSLEIGFNVNYLLDVLNAVGSEQVKLSFTDANNSALIEEVEGTSAQYVVMPMRL